jgi:hypothetical protein
MMKKSIASILALILVFSSVGYLLLRPGKSLRTEEEIPVYPNSAVENVPSFISSQMPFGAKENLRSFLVKKPAKEVLIWYRQVLENRGYRVVRKQDLMTVGISIGPVEIGWLIFARENMGIAVGVAGLENGTFYLLAMGKPSDLAGGEVLPASDLVSGAEPIPRYPGSVMLSYSVSGKEIKITYGTAETNITTVALWFREELSRRGWSIENENIFSAFLLLRRGENELKIDILPAGFYSSIQVVHRS